jgi:MoxR-like ATPase
VEGAPDRRPIVVVTSNSAKSLPEPFLRRCLFFNIRSPGATRRREIVERRNHPFARRKPLFDQAMRFFDELQPQLGRAPGTAELLAWLTALEREAVLAEEKRSEGASLQSLRDLVGVSLGAIAKTKDDLALAQATASNATQGWP